MAPRVELVMRLPQLQNLIKRDPQAYKEEFAQQLRAYQAEAKLFTMKPSRDSPRFLELVHFISHVASCYPEECQAIPQQLVSLLEDSATIMTPPTRKTMVQALILLRNRGMMEVSTLLGLVFRLFRVPDKMLREMLYEYVIADIRGINSKARNEKVNRELQGFMYVMLKDEHSVAAKRSLEVMVELYRRRVWTDARTVNVIATACLSNASRLSIIGVYFFLGIEQKMADDEEEEGGAAHKDAHSMEVNTHSHSKKTKARERDIKKQLKKRLQKIHKAQKKGEGDDEGPQPLFPAIQVLHDPQGFAEKMFKKLKGCTDRFEIKLLFMNFISRLIGFHKLLVLNFYSHIQRYLNSHQAQVTVILAYLVQACHELVPPEEVLPLLKNIANAFVADRCSNEVIAVGLNAIREIIVRTPAVLREDDMDGFVQDLALYTKKKDKGVVMAARTFLNTVRDLYPGLLQGKDRGKNHVRGAQPAAYGDLKVLERVEGAELLQAYEEGRLEGMSGGEEVDEWEEGEEEDEDEGDEEEEEEEGGEVMKEEEEEEQKGDEMEEEEEEEEIGGEEPASQVKEGVVMSRKRKRSSAKEARQQKALDKAERKAQDVLQELVEPPQDQTKRIEAQRILTQEDFEKIRKLKAKFEEARRDPRTVRKGKVALAKKQQGGGGAEKEEEEDGDRLDDEVVDGRASDPAIVRPEDLEGLTKRRRASKEERLMKIIGGKSAFEHTGHAGGLTNTEKQRKKNFMMVRKGKRSVFSKLRDTQQERKARKAKGAKSKFKREARKRRRT